MLRARIIPCLLVHNKGLVKTTKFADPKYVGDPLNAVRIFNEKEVDELMVLDIDATVNQVEPNYEMIKHLASECRMPLCYGGGIRSVEQAVKIIQLGVEKVALSAAAIENPNLITDIGQRIGAQSVVTVLDVKKKRFSKSYDVFTHNASHRVGVSPIELVKAFQAKGAGEIVINVIDRDGMMHGYDVDLMSKIREAVTIPITALGGAGSLEDMATLTSKLGIMGVAAGSLFVFKGKYKAVLINYPDYQKKIELIGVS